jgi:hypothetical protein
MSTILKALRRLEEQKSAASPRPLRDEVVLTPTRRRSHNGVIVALVAAFAFAVLGGAAVWLLERAPATTPAPIAEVAPAADVAAPPPSEAAIAVEQAARTNEVTVAAPDPFASGAQAPAVPVPATTPDFEIVRPRPQAQRAPVAAVEEAASVEREEIVVARPSGAAPLPDTEPGFVDEEIPAARVKRSHAPVRVERTQWHPDPGRRIAWVEVEGTTALREVREGERIGPYVVREIEPAAVSFADGSAEVRSEVGR